MFRSVTLSLISLAVMAKATPPAPNPGPDPARPAAQSRTGKDRVIAEIAGRPVRESEFMAFLDVAYTPEQRLQIGMTDGAMEQVQDEYLQTRLLAAKARKDGLDKGRAYARQLQILETDLLVRTLFERNGARLQEQSKVTDAEVKAYYDRNPGKFTTTETFTARRILVGARESAAPDAKPLSDEAVAAKLAKVMAALKGGRSFEDTARELSDDAGTRDSGGLYENVRFDFFAPEIQEAVRRQKPGDVGEPVKTETGYHILRVEKISPSVRRPFEEAREEARQLASRERQEQVMEAFVAAIKKEIPYRVLAGKPARPGASAAGSN